MRHASDAGDAVARDRIVASPGRLPEPGALRHADCPHAISLEAGGAGPLTVEEEVMSAAAAGAPLAGRYLDPARLAPAYHTLLGDLITRPNVLDRVGAMVDVGLPYDTQDKVGITPVMVAGWNGLADALGRLVSLKPDLAHVNGYGGTLLGTILHGSENAPADPRADHVVCLRLVLTHGLALPEAAIKAAGDSKVAAFLRDWAVDHLGQVVATP